MVGGTGRRRFFGLGRAVAHDEVAARAARQKIVPADELHGAGRRRIGSSVAKETIVTRAPMDDIVASGQGPALETGDLAIPGQDVLAPAPFQKVVPAEQVGAGVAKDAGVADDGASSGGVDMCEEGGRTMCGRIIVLILGGIVLA